MIQKSTLDYYNANAQDFVQGTVRIDFHITQDKFLALLPKGATILDFGCGSGRDTKYFLERGFTVEPTDGSLELCRWASEYTGIKAKQMLFQELNAVEKYDGIWACASILHLPWHDLTSVMKKMAQALKNCGIIYMSFKYGRFAGKRNSRFFTDLDEERLQDLLQKVGGLEAKELWITGDARPGRGEEKWLNALITKRSNRK